eukprot:tig00020538_g10340.t1
MFFLDELLATAMPLPAWTLDEMEKTYRFSSTRNVEIGFRWLMICLKSRHLAVMPQVELFLAQHGRGLYVKPLYKTLAEVDEGTARRVYRANRPFYHSVIRNVFDGTLA